MKKHKKGKAINIYILYTVCCMNNVIQFQVENTEQKYHSILSLSDQAQICAVSFSYELFRSSFLDASNGLV